MSKTSTPGMNAIMRRAVACLLVGSALLYANTARAQQPDERTIGPNACTDCHAVAQTLWQQTAHATLFPDFATEGSALAIAASLGQEVESVDSVALCRSCHLTVIANSRGAEAVAGVSCESCHGSARDYLEPHATYGAAAGPDDETPEHREARLATVEAAGMVGRAPLTRWARRCFACHVVGAEALVNDGGHPIGEPVELVAWTQGSLRHNTWYTLENAEAPLPHRQRMYVVGRALEVEYTLRAIARATRKGTYAVKMAARYRAAIEALRPAVEALGYSPLAQLIEVADAVHLELGNADNLFAAAEQVGILVDRFEREAAQINLTPLEPMLPVRDAYVRNQAE